jgi:hypothetical protein
MEIQSEIAGQVIQSSEHAMHVILRHFVLIQQAITLPRFPKVMTAKYFLPDWEDRLDPDFDFLNDKYSANHIKNPYIHDQYAHQMLDTPPYDGLLMSLSIFQSKMKLDHINGVYKIRNIQNIRDYLKIPHNSNLKIMGDCGAFSYADMKEPPLPIYSIENIAGIYDKLGFDYGVSVDHLALDYILIKDTTTGKRKKLFLSKEEKENRVKITLKNAKIFKKYCEAHQSNFIPIGVAQGYDEASYVKSVSDLVDMGYDHLGIGGLVQYKSEFILKILKEIQYLIKGTKLHLFGVLRTKYLKDFEDLGVSSFDSASFLRKAWLKSEQNYLSLDGRWYSAIRVPQSSNPRLLKNASLNGFSSEELEGMERRAMQALVKFDEGKLRINDTFNIVL